MSDKPTPESLKRAKALTLGCRWDPSEEVALEFDEIRREEHSNRGEVMAACILAHRNGWTVGAVARLKEAVEQLIAKDEP